MSIHDDMAVIILAFSYTEHYGICHDECERVKAWLDAQSVMPLIGEKIWAEWEGGDPALLEAYQAGYLDGMHVHMPPDAQAVMPEHWEKSLQERPEKSS